MCKASSDAIEVRNDRANMAVPGGDKELSKAHDAHSRLEWGRLQRHIADRAQRVRSCLISVPSLSPSWSARRFVGIRHIPEVADAPHINKMTEWPGEWPAQPFLVKDTFDDIDHRQKIARHGSPIDVEIAR